MESILWDVSQFLRVPYNTTFRSSSIPVTEELWISVMAVDPEFYIHETNLNAGSSIYPITVISHNFLTCHKMKAGLSFIKYVNAFDLNFWITAVTFLGFVGLGFHLFFKILLKSPDNFYTWCFFVILEQEVMMSKKLSKFFAFKILISALLLTGLVLTNTYKGMQMRDLTLPLPGSRLELLEEALAMDFDIILQLENDSYELYMSSQKRYVREGGGDLEKTKRLRRDSLYQQFARNAIYKLLTYTYKKMTPANRRIYNRIIIPRNESTYVPEEELAKCNKSILLEEPKELKTIFLRSLRHGNSSLYFGKDEILQVSKYFRFVITDWERSGVLQRRMKSLFHSGLFHYDTTDPEFELKFKIYKAKEGEVSRSFEY
jgi:hypothetical protein